MVRSVNINNKKFVPFSGPGPYEVQRKHLTPEAEACNLGCSYYRLDPGKKACPAHYHFGNDEAIFVLEGSLTLWLAGKETELAAGSYVTLPCGTGEAHQLENRTDQPAVYLCFSTMNKTDVILYPDSGKIGVFGGVAPGGTEAGTSIRQWVSDDVVDYWQGEET